MVSLIILTCIVILVAGGLITVSILQLAKVLEESNEIYKSHEAVSKSILLTAEKALSLNQDSYIMNRNYLDSVEGKNIEEMKKLNQEKEYLIMMMKDLENRTKKESTKRKTTKKENNTL